VYLEDPTDSDLVAGLELYDADKYEEAEPLLRCAADRGNVTALFKLANTLSRLDREEEAIPLLEIASEQDHAGASNNLGLILFDRGQVDEAIALYAKAAEAGLAQAMFNLGIRLDEAGDADGARAWLLRAIEGGLGRACAALGNMLILEGELEEARRLYERGADLGNLSSCTCAGKERFEAKDYAPAEAWFRRGINLPEDPDESRQLPHAFAFLGLTLVLAGRSDEAIEYLERAVSMGNHDVEGALAEARSNLAPVPYRAQTKPAPSSRSALSWEDLNSGARVFAGDRFCRECAAERSGDSHFCVGCGFRGWT